MASVFPRRLNDWEEFLHLGPAGIKGGKSVWIQYTCNGTDGPTVYSVQCTVYGEQCTVYSVQCTVYTVTDLGLILSLRLYPMSESPMLFLLPVELGKFKF